MAFGKDPRQLQAMAGGFGRSTFGQQSATSNNKTKGRTGGGAYWRDNFEISENPADPDTFRLVRGEYKQAKPDASGNLFEDTYGYVSFRDHYHNSLKKGAICSAGPYFLDPKRREPCEGCDIFWEDAAVRTTKKSQGDNSQGPKRISMTSKFAFNLWSFAQHFAMPDVDKNGQYRMNPKTNQPYTNWVGTKNPNLPQFAGRPYKAGHLWSWSIGNTWKETLSQWNQIIENSCTTCGGRDCVVSRGWYCANCRQLIIDPNNTHLSREVLLETINKHHTCLHCKHYGYLQESVWCHHCPNGEHGQRASIFDVDLTGFRQRVSDTQTILTITNFSNPYNLQARITDPELLKSLKPRDLLAKFAPTPIEVQRKIWNIQGTRAPAPQPGFGGPPPNPGYMPQLPSAYGGPQGYAPSTPQSTSYDPDDITSQLNALSNFRV